MKLSLSVRIAESFARKDQTTMTFDEIVQLAQGIGYDAVCMRASQVGIDTDPAIVQQRRAQLDAAGLKVSMVTGDFEVPRNNDRGPDCLRKITPYLDLAERFGAKMIRVCMKKDVDIPWAQRAADEAQERQIRLVHQAHCASLFETVADSVRVLQAIDRPNFGLIYEPANWMISGQDYVAAVQTVGRWIFNVYVQNHRLAADATDSVLSWQRGRVHLEHIGLWDSGGVDFEAVFAALHKIGYQGYVTVHQALAGVMSPQEAARRSYEYLVPRVSPPAERP